MVFILGRCDLLVVCNTHFSLQICYVITVLVTLRAGGNSVIAIATNGVSVTLLDGERMIHSAFKVPIDAHKVDKPTCHITNISNIAVLFRGASILVR